MGTRIHFRLERRRMRLIELCKPLKEYAQEKNVHPDTVRYWIQKGRTVGFKVAGRWYVRDPIGGDS